VSDILPAVDDCNEAFWRGGSDGRLHIFQCSSCRYFVHPPAPVCPSCYGRSVAPVAVSGRGTVYSFTVNHQRWDADASPEPYVIAIVELVEQEELRVLTNLVGCVPDDVRIGMEVAVEFREREDLHLPVFSPVDVGPSA
jgi:uncharacterized protein